MSKTANKLAEARQKIDSNAQSATPAAGADTGERWDDLNRRATFHLPNALLEDLAAFCARTGRSRAEVVRTALADHIAK